MFLQDKLRQNYASTSSIKLSARKTNEYIKKAKPGIFLSNASPYANRKLDDIWTDPNEMCLSDTQILAPHEVDEPSIQLSVRCIFQHLKRSQQGNAPKCYHLKNSQLPTAALFGREHPPGRGLCRHNSHNLEMVWGGFSSGKERIYIGVYRCLSGLSNLFYHSDCCKKKTNGKKEGRNIRSRMRKAEETA